MQLKKATRDGHYPESDQYTANAYNSESSDQFAEVPESFAVRTARGAAQPQSGESTDRPAAVTRSESVIDQHSSFDGRFETEHDLRVEGTISGEVTCRGLFTVKKDATARVRVQTRDAHIQGKFEGDIVCTGKLLLAATAHVTGTLKAAVLVVEEGAAVSGTMETMQNGAVVSRAPAASNGDAPEKPAQREPATVSRGVRRDLPSFAIVASDGAAAGDRN
ncbi:MAG: polymer-forming cytoskeletal protein [bacterium]